MRQMTVLAAALAAASISGSAMADYVQLGSVEVGDRAENTTSYSEFGGPVEDLRFTAGGSDVYCRTIRVRYANGTAEDVFHGPLPENQPVDVDVRGRAQRVDHIAFSCRSAGYRGATITISADVGRYRDEWRRDRRWGDVFGFHHDDMDRHGDRDHGWGDRDGWQTLGSLSFEGSNDKESTFAGWRGNRVDTIGLRPLNDDAQCMRIVVVFASGKKAKLYADGPLQQGRVTKLDLPGGDRDVQSLYLRCRAVNGRQVSIEILVRQ